MSEKDIKSAQSQIAQDIRPQIDKLLSDAEGAMAKLMNEERELEATVSESTMVSMYIRVSLTCCYKGRKAGRRVESATV